MASYKIITVVTITIAVISASLAQENGYGHEEYAYPKYTFEYQVKDDHTKDIKSQQESRDGHYVKGYYSLLQPDGKTRTVHYNADEKQGFNAIVNYEGGSYGYSAPSYSAPSYSAPSYSAPSYSAPAPKYSAPSYSSPSYSAASYSSSSYSNTQHNAPRYNAPAPSYNAPSYSAPAPRYNAPSPSYSSHSPSYSSSHSAYSKASVSTPHFSYSY